MIASASLKRGQRRPVRRGGRRFRGVIASASLKRAVVRYRSIAAAGRFRGVIASASLKPVLCHPSQQDCRRFRGVIASASLKRNSVSVVM